MNKISKFKLSIIILVATFSIGILGWFLQNKLCLTQLEIPNNSWEKIFFKSINNVTELSSLKELRKTNLSKNDIEIRIWRGFGLSNLEGIVMKKVGDNSSAIHIKGNDYIEITKTTTTNLNSPKSGWDSFWKKIIDAEILIIPDASQINCENSGSDGMSYVVETNHLKKYRTYMYSMNYSKCAEAKQLKRIGEIIAEEFDDGQGSCETAEWIPCARLNRKNLGE